MASKTTWSPTFMTGFAKSSKLRLDYMSYFAWRLEIAHAGETQHGHSAVPRRPRGKSTGRGFNNCGASSSGQRRPARERSIPSKMPQLWI